MMCESIIFGKVIYFVESKKQHDGCAKNFSFEFDGDD